MFLDDAWSIAIVSIIRSTPLEYSAMGAVGLRYDALKDAIEWATHDEYSIKDALKKYTTMIYNLGQYYVGEMKND